jgi:hypothetical protein
VGSGLPSQVGDWDPSNTTLALVEDSTKLGVFSGSFDLAENAEFKVISGTAWNALALDAGNGTVSSIPAGDVIGSSGNNIKVLVAGTYVVTVRLIGSSASIAVSLPA